MSARRGPPWLSDLVLALAVAAAVGGVRAVEISDRHLHDASFAGLGLALASALVLSVRRRWPLTVALLTLAAVPAVIALDSASGAVSLPLLVAVYTCATVERGRHSVALAVTCALGVALARGLIQHKGWSDGRTAAEPALVLAALFLGWAVAARRAYVLETKDRAARAEAAREEEMRRRVDAERLRIARELHDVVAHTIATINVQAGVAVHVIDKQPEAAAQAQSFELTVNGAALSGTDAEARRTDPRLTAAPRTVDLTAMLKPGVNTLVFSAAGDASLASAEATASFYVPWQGDVTTSKTQTGSDAGLDFGYSCEAEDAHVGKAMECSVAARRFGSQSYGMMLAEVGLPPGAEVDRSSLARLLDAGKISRYELQPDRIVFYLWSPQAAGSHFTFRFTPRYAIHAKAAPAILSDYYNPDLNVVLAPQVFSVTGPSQK